MKKGPPCWVITLKQVCYWAGWWKRVWKFHNISERRRSHSKFFFTMGRWEEWTKSVNYACYIFWLQHILLTVTMCFFFSEQGALHRSHASRKHWFCTPDLLLSPVLVSLLRKEPVWVQTTSPYLHNSVTVINHTEIFYSLHSSVFLEVFFMWDVT